MSFRTDRRSQAIQIGAVLLFGVLIVLFATYQAVVVPGQNSEVEFNHNQRVQGDMVEVRNAILETKTTGDDGYATLELGTRFPPRLVALNPSPPSGSLTTTDLRPVVIQEDGTDITTEVCPGSDIRTRFLEYDPSYAEYTGAGTLRFENSLLYHDFGDQTVLLTGQSLVQGDTVRIVPLRRSLGIAGTRTIAIEPVAGLVDTAQRENLTVTVPTQLSESAWEDALEGQLDPANVSVTTGAGGRNLTLSLDGAHRIDCGPVGLGEAPPSGERGGSVDEINPAAPGDIRLVNETRTDPSSVRLTFNNTARTNNFTEGRINFYRHGSAAGGNKPTETTVAGAGQPVSATLPIRGDFQTFSPKITLQGDGNVTNVDLNFDGNVNDAWFVITLRLETGERALYFVPV